MHWNAEASATETGSIASLVILRSPDGITAFGLGLSDNSSVIT